MNFRTKSRIIALQSLYELDLTDHDLVEIVSERSEEDNLDSEQYAFALAIVKGVCDFEQQLDSAIAIFAPEWPMDQVAVIDRNILRMALWELAIYKHTPLKVGINEAVELAKNYGTDSSPRFVNGVLGSLADNMDKISRSLVVEKL